MKHPDPQLQRKQEDFLRTCPDTEREFHARIFRVGNAAFCYHQQASSAAPNDETLKIYFAEWLAGLPDNIRQTMSGRGFEECKSILSFMRYVNERNDIGMSEWMKAHLSPEDYIFYQRENEK
jgi:hypothetical protein